MNQQRFTCPKCNGQGSWGSFGACRPHDIHFKHPCRGCNGNGFVMMAAPPQPCNMCQGKGGQGTFGPCSEEDVHYKSPCQPCGGRGFLVAPCPAQPPAPCPLCPTEDTVSRPLVMLYVGYGDCPCHRTILGGGGSERQANTHSPPPPPPPCENNPVSVFWWSMETMFCCDFAVILGWGMVFWGC